MVLHSEALYIYLISLVLSLLPMESFFFLVINKNYKVNFKVINKIFKVIDFQSVQQKRTR